MTVSSSTYKANLLVLADSLISGASEHSSSIVSYISTTEVSIVSSSVISRVEVPGTMIGAFKSSIVKVLVPSSKLTKEEASPRSTVIVTGMPFGDTVAGSVLSQSPTPYLKLTIVDCSGSKYGGTVLGSIETWNTNSTIAPAYCSTATCNVISVTPKESLSRGATGANSSSIVSV